MTEPTEEQLIADQVAADIGKGLISYSRGRTQIEHWGRYKPTIDVGECIEWLDRNIKKVGYEEHEDADGVIKPIDHSGYYTGSNEDGANLLEAAKQNALEAKQHPFLVHREGMPQISTSDLARANQKAIDVTARVAELTGRAEEELGVIDADE